MNLTDVLFNAAGGGVVGSLLHLGTSFFETWQAKKKAEVEILLLNAKVAAAEKEAAWNAFAKSQEGSNNGLTRLPENTHPVVSNVFVLTDALRNFTRPGLTWAGFFLVCGIYYSATPEIRAGMTNEAQFGFWTMAFWWVGSRYSRAGK